MTTRRLAPSLLATAGLLSAVSLASAACTHPKCSVDLKTTTNDTVPVILQYTTDPSDSEVNAVGNFGPISRHLHQVKAISVQVPASQLNTLANRPGVTFVSMDRKLSAHQMTAAPGPIGTSPEFTAEPINAPWALAQNFNGQGIGVAVIDSGISVVNDLGPSRNNGPLRVVYSKNFVPNETTTADAFGHGTHVAGLIAGNGAASTGKAYTRTFQGIAPNANIINLRALDENGQGSDSSVIAAIEEAIALKLAYNIKVINLSLGRPIYESYTQDPLCQAVEQAWKAGIVVVVAAGNDGRDLALNSEGYGTIEAPGNDPYVITVGATNAMNTATVTDDVMATYSSKGPSFIDQIAKPDIVAPGNLVTSLLAPGSALQQQNPNFYTPMSWYVAGGSAQASTNYYPLSGTSMATAVASGAVADLMEVASYLTPDQVKVLLMTSANKTVIPATNVVLDPDSGTSFTAHNDVFTQGAGYLDLQATIKNTWNYAYTIPIIGYALSPTATYNATTGDVTLNNTASTILWGRSTSASTSLTTAGAVYGQSAFSSNAAPVWGSTILWGRSDPQAFTSLWGNSSTWSQGSPDAATILWGRDDTSSSSTILWGRNNDSGNTILWGRDTTHGSRAPWGR